MKYGTVLGLIWNKNTEIMLTKFNRIFYGVSLVGLVLDSIKVLVEGILLSQIQYKLEITTGGKDSG